MKTKREESNTLTLNTGKVSLVGVLSLINDFVLKTQRISENVHCKTRSSFVIHLKVSWFNNNSKDSYTKGRCSVK